MAQNEEWGKPVERRGVSYSSGVIVTIAAVEIFVCTVTVSKLSKQRLTAVLALATLISAFGSSFQYGYNVAVVNSPSPVT